MNRISTYLDYNATAPLYPKAWAAIEAWVKDHAGHWGNPSSVHHVGRQAFHIIQKSRQTIAQQLGAWDKQVIFTASGTEANNWVMQSYIHKNPTGHILVAATEHPSILRTAEHYGRTCPTLRISLLPVNCLGLIDLTIMEALLQTKDPTPALICVMLANNETGVIQPIKDIKVLARQHHAWLHCDAVQALGKIPIHFGDSDVDFMSFSGHKIGAPPGIGLLLAKYAEDLQPLYWGGRQEHGLRSGTENVMGIAGLSEAMADLDNLLTHQKNLSNWQQAMELNLKTCYPEVQIVGKDVQRLPNTSCIITPGVSAQTQLMALDIEGIAVSTGSACASGKVSDSHVLKAMGIDEASRKTAIRVSTGWATQPEDYDRFVQHWKRLVHRIQGVEPHDVQECAAQKRNEQERIRAA